MCVGSAKRILINAAQEEELRVAIIDGKQLYSLDIESVTKEQQKSNIYKAKVTRIERSLGAVFADFGAEKHGFLSGREITKDYFKPSTTESLPIAAEQKVSETTSEGDKKPQPGNEPDKEPNEQQDNKLSYGNLPLEELIHEGQELIVQVEKEQRGTKGAALTTFISLAGCYLVLMPNNPRAGGISKRIEGEDREKMKTALKNLNLPKEMGVIVRTAGIGRSLEELQWDLDVLLKQWQAICDAANARPAPFLIYQESNLVIRCIRDHLRPDIQEILIDNPKLFDMVYQHMALMRPDFLDKVKLYNDTVPLFSKFHIESQIESAYQREVKLKSGGSLVIDHTEALTSIDINSAKATKGSDIEETALQTNLEAAEEIARQLRLRDLGGLIVIDFIDMTISRNQREVEQRLKNSMATDRAKIQLGKISKFGLLEMSRQRLRPNLSESIEISCPRCIGKGTIRSVATMSLNIIRLIEENAIENNIGMVVAELPIELATFLMNEKRDLINSLEKKHRVKIAIAPNKYINIPDYEVKAIKKSDLPKVLNKQLNRFNLDKTLSTTKEATEYNPTEHTLAVEIQKPAVINNNEIPAPTPTNSTNSTNSTNNSNNMGKLIKKLWQAITGQQTNILTKEQANSAPKKFSNNNKKKYRHNHKSKVHNRQSKGNHKNNYYNERSKNKKRRPHNNHKTNKIEQNISSSN